MDFNRWAYESETGDKVLLNPFGGKIDGEWFEGETSLNYLQTNFKNCENLDECIESTKSEGLKLFFEYLKTQQ